MIDTHADARLVARLRQRARQKAAATEPGADGKPQLLIPGVAPIGARDRLELRARQPLRGGNAPPPAGGLFDLDGRRQADLLDKPR